MQNTLGCNGRSLFASVIDKSSKSAAVNIGLDADGLVVPCTVVGPIVVPADSIAERSHRWEGVAPAAAVCGRKRRSAGVQLFCCNNVIRHDHRGRQRGRH